MPPSTLREQQVLAQVMQGASKPNFNVNQLHLLQFNYHYLWGYAGWSKDQQRIVIGAAIAPPRFQDEDVFTANDCTDLLHDVKAGLLSVYGTDNLPLLMQFWFEYSGSRWRAGDFDRIVAITNIKAKLSRSGALGKWKMVRKERQSDGI
jgi:hypothetical protein